MSIEKLTKPSRINEDRIETLKELFPEAFADGKLNLQIFQEEVAGLDEELIEDNIEESYGLRWVGKKEARRLAFLTPEGTLRFAEGEGVNEEATKNIFIEGDNLEVLRILQNSYKNRIKVIYIDPPYNTGNDFVYKDDFKEPIGNYLQRTGQLDEEGLLTSNPKASGRFHANWLNMMYPRLKLARNLLKNDGVIFVSNDDNEHANLKKILDEIFGEENFITNIIWKHTQQSKNDEPYFSRHHNSILVYRKSSDLPKIRGERTEEDNRAYSNPDNDPKGPWRSGDVRSPSLRETLKYIIKTPSGNEILPPENGWRWSKGTLQEKIDTGEIIFSDDETRIIRKIYLADQEGRTPENVFLPEIAGTTREATNELKELFGTSPFDTPKPTKLIKRLIKLVSKGENDIILDFFAGSGTTAHAMLELNQEDGGKRNFILIQIPEQIKKGEYKTIADIAKERVRRSIKKLNELDNNEKGLDRGFAVYKLDKTNLRKWNGYKGESLEQLEDNLDFFTHAHFTEGWTEKDVVIELMLHQRYPLDSHIEQKKGANILWIVKHEEIPSKMIVCLDNSVEQSTIEQITSSFGNDVFICFDDALSNQAKVILSEIMKVKTI